MRTGLTVAIAIAIVIAAVMAEGIVSRQCLRDLSDTDQRVTRSHEVIAQLRAVRLAVTDAETEERGYVLTGGDAHLAAFRRTANALPAELDRLETLIADSGERTDIRRFRRLAEERANALQRVIDARSDPARGEPEAVRVIRAGHGRQTMDDLRRMATELEAVEQERLRGHAAEAAAADRAAGHWLGVATAFGIGLCGVLVLLIRWHLQSREQGAARLRAAHDALEERVRDRTGKLMAANVLLEAEAGERARTEAVLRASEERFRDLADAMPQVVWVLAADGRVEYRNRRAVEVTGHLDPDNPSASVHPDDRAALMARSAEGMAAGKPFECEYRLRVVTTGEYRWHLGRAVPGRNAVGQPIRWYGTATDIHDLKAAEAARQRAEDGLRQGQKMEAVGHLAGGVAHDFNNLLTVINGYAELLQSSLPDTSPAREMASEVLAAGRRAASLTHQLLAFSRQQTLTPQLLDLNGLVDRLRRMLGRLIGEDIHLATSQTQRLGQVLADPGQVEQVLLNLCVNARDAMPTGGRLMIETAEVELAEGNEQLTADRPPGRYARLSVTDTGCGMTDAVKARIFEPFFTTKGVGKGTGMGLATAYGIVTQSGGYMAVYSEVGVGTTVKVYLPVVASPVEASEEPTIESPPRGRETVLLVEDERGVRRLAAGALREAGYTVLEAAEGEEAAATHAAHPEVRLLLTDVVMPGAGGRVLAERLRAATPRLRVLYTSGYPDDAVVRHGIVSADVAFLQKPFAVGDLLRKVRQVLDDPGSGLRA